MKLPKKLFLIILSCLLLVGLFGNTVLADKDYVLDYNTNEKKIIVTTKHAELHIAKDYITEKEIYNITNKIEKGIRVLKDYLGKKYINYDFNDLGKIKYFIKSGNGYSKGNSTGRIHLYYVHLKQSPYIHETAHVLLDKKEVETSEIWLTEGLPTYLNSKFAEYPSKIIRDYYKPNKITKKIINNKIEKYKLVLDYFPKFFYRNQKERKVFYHFAGSFIKFIEDNYGKEKLLKLYNAKRKESFTITALEDDSSENSEATSKSTEDILGTSIDELKEKWLANVQS